MNLALPGLRGASAAPRRVQAAALAALLAFRGSGASAQAPELVPVPGAHVPSLAWPSEILTLHSDGLDEDVRLYIAKPPSYGRTQRSYPVLLLLDGQYYFAEVASSVAALVGTGQIPELVLVGIESHDRRRDFTPAEIQLDDVGDEARADQYLDFLEHELMPALESRLHCGRPRVLLGHSHAAILVLHALARRPSVFPWGIELDAPVHLEHDFLARSLTESLQAEERPSVRLVSCAARFGWSDERWRALEASARAGDLLRRNEMPEESHESMVFAASYRGLQQLFADASTLGARELSALEIEQRFLALAPAYGCELPPPEPLLRRVIEDMLMEGFGARAGEWLERYERVYGRASDHDDLARRVSEVTVLGEPTETVADLLALPRATPAEMKDHLGTWSGSTQTNDAPPRPIRVRFWVENGAVLGELAHEVGPVSPIEYLRFRPDGGLEFGFKNGMRPRGLILYEEERPGGALEGEMRFRGIRFVPPDGYVPPRMRFELTRLP